MTKPTLGRPLTQPPTTNRTTAAEGILPNGAVTALSTHVTRLLDEVGKVIVGKRTVIEKLVITALTEGAHILFEDVPGLAKSVMASTFSKAAGCTFHRIQFTPDLLPTDITGGHIFNRKTNEFDFRPGPIFTNFLLADEINRASPKTQSALLEAMAEKQVSIEGVTHQLAAPFTVLATMNPVEQEGTYNLPEAQMDRFAMRLSVGYPNKAEEIEIMARRLTRKKDGFDVRPVIDRDRLLAMQKSIEDIVVSPHILDYIASLVDESRRSPLLSAGASPRGSLALVKMARARAAIKGRNYVLPDDVQAIAVDVLAHRVILTTDARVQGISDRTVIEELLQKVPVPRPTRPVPA